MIIKRLDNSSFLRWKEEIVNLIDESYRINFNDYDIPKECAVEKCNSIERYLKDGSAIIFVAFQDDQLLGWIWCHRVNRLDRVRLHVAELAVARHSRSMGIGTSLMKSAEAYAKEEGITELDLLVTASNTCATSFYEKSGFDVERYLMKKSIK